MRYFTRGWCRGECTDEEQQKARDTYWRRVSELHERLPPSVVDLTKTGLHDGQISLIRWNPRKKELRIELVIGDNQIGISDACLGYSGVQLRDQYTEILKARARDRETCILYDEVDIESDGILVHRLLFHPEGELSIWFTGFAISTSSRADRRINLSPCFLEEE